jgi:hypothetical protein
MRGSRLITCPGNDLVERRRFSVAIWLTTIGQMRPLYMGQLGELYAFFDD